MYMRVFIKYLSVRVAHRERRAAVKDILRAGRINCEAAAGGALEGEGTAGSSQRAPHEEEQRGPQEAQGEEEESPKRKSREELEQEGEEQDEGITTVCTPQLSQIQDFNPYAHKYTKPTLATS